MKISLQNVQTHNVLRSYICDVSNRVQNSMFMAKNGDSNKEPPSPLAPAATMPAPPAPIPHHNTNCHNMHHYYHSSSSLIMETTLPFRMYRHVMGSEVTSVLVGTEFKVQFHVQQTQYPTKQLHTVDILLLLSQCQCLLTIRHSTVLQLDFRPPTEQDGRNKMASNMTAQIPAVKYYCPTAKMLLATNVMLMSSTGWSWKMRHSTRKHKAGTAGTMFGAAVTTL